MAIPFPVLVTIPIPFVILLVLLTCYHLTPLLTLLPHLTPLLSKLANLIPRPRRPRNLPREFFNLPPRPEDDASSTDGLHVGSVLGVRGKLMLLLLAQTTVSIACGWALLMVGPAEYTSGTAILLALSIIPLPSTVATLALFTACPYQARQRHYTVDSTWRRTLLRGGRITHDTLFARILPFSLVPVIIGFVLAAAVPRSVGYIVLIISTIMVTSTIGLALASRLRGRRYLSRGAIRLRSSSPGLASSRYDYDNSGELIEKDIEDWITSPSNTSNQMSAFSYSPSVSTPHPRAKSSTARSETDNGTPNSWLSSPTATPSTMPEWTYSPGDTIATPGSAITRDRSRSPSPVPPLDNLPRPAPPQPQTAKSSATTMYTMTLSTPGSGLRSIGGSMLGEYSPDPFQPMPRNFQSLSSYPISPSRLATPEFGAVQSRTSLLTRALQSADTLAFEPEERTASTFTLESYDSAEDFVTPASKRRAPPPPPMPTDLPLPPTPTFARSETLFDWPHKDSTEMLMGERDWVEVVGEGAVSEWGRDGRGVGILALLTVLICFALNVPLLVSEISDTTLSLYLVSLVLPSPLLAVTSYLLRYRPAKPIKKGSTQSISTHRSLALCSESQLSLPVTMSPKLTPPVEKRHSKNATFGTLLEPKPSISNFGYDRGGRRPHTMYEAAQWDREAEARLKRTLNRRSGDVWLEKGHAIEAGGLLSRAVEMIKPYPALRVLDSLPDQPASLKRFRGGVMSMFGGRADRMDEEHAMANVSAPTISISSPSKYDRRVSCISTCEGEEIDRTLDSTEMSAEIKTALLGRMSKSPTFYCCPNRSVHDTDWLTANVLPNLVPGITIGPNVRVAPRPVSMEPPMHRWTSAGTHPSLDPPSSSRRAHGSSSSVDWTPRRGDNDLSFDHSTPVSTTRNRLRHKKSFSLPTITPADFTDVRRSFYDCGRDEQGVDLPLIPHALSPVAEESTQSFGSLALGVIHADRIGMDSMVSEDEAMAEEMEQVMAMDTPTRAEFVISPPLSSVVSRRASSRASLRSDKSSKTTESVPPVPDVRSSVHSEDTLPVSLKAEINFSRPTPRLHTQPSMPVMSHPHPPPLHTQPSLPSMASVNMAPRPNITEAHPPCQARTLINKQSSETLRSQASGVSSDAAHRYEDAEEFRPSRSELILVQRLKERKAQTAKDAPASPVKPLQLLADRRDNRMSAGPLPLPKPKRVSVLADRPSSGAESVVASHKGSAGVKVSKRSKASTGSGKENRRVHKGSTVSTGSSGVIRV